jgi:hypothetical protein
MGRERASGQVPASSAKVLLRVAALQAGALQPCGRCTAHAWSHASPRLGPRPGVTKPRTQQSGNNLSVRNCGTLVSPSTVTVLADALVRLTHRLQFIS